SRLVLDSAEKIAERINQESSDLDAFIVRAFREILGIQVDASMIASSKNAMERWRGLPNTGIGQGSAIADRILLVWTLLNHNDFVTLR
ncbi:MAG: hypothetical protein ACKO9Q_20130, partial [Pirellula sp.]